MIKEYYINNKVVKVVGDRFNKETLERMRKQRKINKISQDFYTYVHNELTFLEGRIMRNLSSRLKEEL